MLPPVITALAVLKLEAVDVVITVLENTPTVADKFEIPVIVPLVIITFGVLKLAVYVVPTVMLAMLLIYPPAITALAV